MSAPPPAGQCPVDNESTVFMTYTVDRLGNDLGALNLGVGTTYVFSPTPLMEATHNVLFSGKEQIGTDIILKFSGHLVAPKFINYNCGHSKDVGGDFQEVPGTEQDIEHPPLDTGRLGITILNALMRRMSQVLSVPGGEFHLYEKCTDDQGNETRTTFFKCYPSAISDITFSQSQDQWTTTIPYSFTMTISRTDIYDNTSQDGYSYPLYLESINEEWSVQPANEGNAFEDIVAIKEDSSNEGASASRAQDILDYYREVLDPDKTDDEKETAKQAILDRLNLDDHDASQNKGTRIFTVTHTLSATGKTVYGLQMSDPSGLYTDPYGAQHGSDSFNSETDANAVASGTAGIHRTDNQNIHEWKAKSQSEASQESYDLYTSVLQNNSMIQTQGFTAYDYARKWVEGKLYNAEHYFDPSQTSTSGKPRPRKNINSKYGFTQSTADGTTSPERQDWTTDTECYVDPQDLHNDNNGSPPPCEDIFVLDEDLCFMYPTRSAGKVYNHTRQKSGNRINGTYSVTETWTLIVGQYADYGATDDYSLDYVADTKTGTDKVTMSGTIQGYAGGNIYWKDQAQQNTKITNAENLFNLLMIGEVFFRRAQDFFDKMRRYDKDGIIAILSDGETKHTLNHIPLNRSIKKQTKEGILQYTFEFDSRCYPFVPGAIYESFNSQMQYPADVFGTVVIPGRQQGPLFFSANTQTAPKYTLSYEVVMPQQPCLTRKTKDDWHKPAKAKEIFDSADDTGGVFTPTGTNDSCRNQCLVLDGACYHQLEADMKAIHGGVLTQEQLDQIEEACTNVDNACYQQCLQSQSGSGGSGGSGNALADRKKMIKNIKDKVKTMAASPRKYLIPVIQAHYEYLQSLGWDVIKVESDSDTWNMQERRLSGTVSFTGTSCKSLDKNQSITQIIKKAIEAETQDTTNSFPSSSSSSAPTGTP